MSTLIIPAATRSRIGTDILALRPTRDDEIPHAVGLFETGALAGRDAREEFALVNSGRAPSTGAVVDAVAQPGGPRYLYTDPLMLETSMRWIEIV